MPARPIDAANQEITSPCGGGDVTDRKRVEVGGAGGEVRGGPPPVGDLGHGAVGLDAKHLELIRRWPDDLSQGPRLRYHRRHRWRARRSGGVEREALGTASRQLEDVAPS